jgi:hypothetical protein
VFEGVEDGEAMTYGSSQELIEFAKDCDSF